MHQQAIERLRQAGQRRRFDQADRLMTIGTPSHEVLLLETGVVKVLLSAGNGSELIADLYGPGELIGELGVMSDRPRSATVIGHSPGTAVHVQGTVFRALARRHPDVLVMVNATLERRLRNADERQIAMASRDVSTRVAYQLLTWAKKLGHADSDGLAVHHVKQQELAQAVNASVKSVEDALRELRGDGLLTTGRMRYLLPDPQRLAELLDDPDWKPGR